MLLIYNPRKKEFKIIDIKNPKKPSKSIPTAETFAICSYSFLDGFFKISHTLLHLEKKDFVEFHSSIV